jgi:hypothetical protein
VGAARLSAAALSAAALSAAALWIQARVVLWVGVRARRLNGAPRSGIRRQISLPSAISLSATSRLTEIHWTGPAALHFEQIDARARRASAHDDAQVGG